MSSDLEDDDLCRWGAGVDDPNSGIVSCSRCLPLFLHLLLWWWLLLLVGMLVGFQKLDILFLSSEKIGLWSMANLSRG